MMIYYDNSCRIVTWAQSDKRMPSIPDLSLSCPGGLPTIEIFFSYFLFFLQNLYYFLFLSPSKFHRQLKAFQGWTHGRPIIFRRLRLKILTDFFSKYFLIATQYILYSKLKAYITGLTQNRFYFQANKHDVIKVYQQSNYLSLSLSFKHLKGQSEPCFLGWVGPFRFFCHWWSQNHQTTSGCRGISARYIILLVLDLKIALLY